MWERSKTSRVSWPEIVIATFSETPRSNQVANRRPPQVMDDKTSVPLVVGSFNVSQPFEPHGSARDTRLRFCIFMELGDILHASLWLPACASGA